MKQFSRLYLLLPAVAVLVAGIAILLSCSTTPGFDDDQREPIVRVCLSDKGQTARIYLQGDAIMTSGSATVALRDSGLYMATLSDDGQLVLEAKGRRVGVYSESLRIYYSTPRNRFGFEGKLFSDTLTLATEGRNIYVINTLPLERYLESVVVNEIGRNRKATDFEAVKAQAIMARTYALTRIDLPLKRLFDMHDDTRDQVFEGTTQPDMRAAEAVNATRGVVLMANDRYAEGYYHACCGGKTEGVADAWPKHQQRQYLSSISDGSAGGDYCRISPSYRWTVEYPRETLEPILKTNIPEATDEFKTSDFTAADRLLDIAITKRSKSGRVAELTVYLGSTRKYKTIKLHGDAIRKALIHPASNKYLKSTLFDIKLERDSRKWITNVTVNGGGHGHGIGMCQWGAIGRSRQGANAEKILQHYFRGTELMQLY